MTGAVRNVTGEINEALTGRSVTDLAALAASPKSAAEPGPLSWETSNLLHLGQALATAAHLREESRGGHVRRDHPERDDERWAAHLVHVREEDGELVVIKLDVELSRPEDEDHRLDADDADPQEGQQ